MKRFVLLLLAGIATAGISAGAASSRAGDWQLLPVGPFDATCGSTVVHVTFPMNNEYLRLVATLPDKTQQYQYAGSIKLNFATDTGASVTVSASSPGTEFIHPDGTIEFIALGHVVQVDSAEQAAALGLPSEIVVTGGPSDQTLTGRSAAPPAASSKTSAQNSERANRPTWRAAHR